MSDPRTKHPVELELEAEVELPSECVHNIKWNSNCLKFYCFDCGAHWTTEEFDEEYNDLASNHSAVWSQFRHLQKVHQEVSRHNLELMNKVDDAYRRGYLDGSTAVNTVGEEALGHVEMHFEKWREEE